MVSDSGSDRIRCEGVQDLLVLNSADCKGYKRIPLFFTQDYLKAAMLMQKPATVLQVPFLFSADAAGWSAEKARAKTRPPIQTVG